MVALAHIVVDVDDLDAAEDFYVAALGGAPEPLPPESQTIYRRLALPGQQVRLLLQSTDDPPANDACRRVHLDLVAEDIDDEAARLERLGAVPVRVEDERGWRFHVLADPYGHLLCVVPADAAPFTGVTATSGAGRGRPCSRLQE